MTSFIVCLLAPIRLPAPVIEEATPTAASSAPRPERGSRRDSDSARSTSTAIRQSQFDGTWTATYKDKVGNVERTTLSTLTIRNGGKSAVSEITVTVRPPTGGWTDVSSEYAQTALVSKWKSISNDLKLDGSNLRVRWEAVELVDWNRKLLSAEQVQQGKNAAVAERGKLSVYTFQGNRLTRDFDSGGGPVYTRVK